MLVGQRSRHRIAPFRLHRPSQAAEAVKMFADCEGAVRYMSGGIDLINRMKAGCSIDDVIDLGAIPDRSAIDLVDGDLWIAAGATHGAVAASRTVRACAPSLSEAWAGVANIRVRTRGTVGGNLMAREISYDFPIVAIALGGGLELMTAGSDLRRIEVADLARTDRSELLTGIRIPQIANQTLMLETRWKPVLAFAVSFLHGGGDDIRRIRLSVGSGFPRFCCSSIEFETPMQPMAVRAGAGECADRLVAALPTPADDWIASARYRRRLLTTLVRRKLAGLERQAGAADA
jgi:carbon-monoxide dehydrogenase medium subunit